MEQTVHRYRFRLSGRGATAECEGRIIETPEGERTLQVWCSTPEHPHILLEAGPTQSEAAIWPLFRKLCDYRNFVPLEYRTLTSRGISEWMPLPGDAPAPPAAGKRKK